MPFIPSAVWPFLGLGFALVGWALALARIEHKKDPVLFDNLLVKASPFDIPSPDHPIHRRIWWLLRIGGTIFLGECAFVLSSHWAAFAALFG